VPAPVELHTESLTIDAHDPAALATFWAAALGWRVVDDAGDEGEIEVRPPDGVAATPLLFVQCDDDKRLKNRLHLDLRPTEDRDAEVARLESLGARQVEIGQSQDPLVTWVVMADPEGNEFCVLRVRQPQR
jgi:predicted enzyme related to lactoylglutathione lyase